jgi:signal transduction histidine kinase
MENLEKSIIPLQWILGNLILFLGLLVFIVLLSRKYIQRIKKESKIKLAHQKMLLENSIEIQERERNRIASEIHDNLIAQLYQVKLINQEKQLSGYIANSIQTARNISHELSPPLGKPQFRRNF